MPVPSQVSISPLRRTAARVESAWEPSSDHPMPLFFCLRATTMSFCFSTRLLEQRNPRRLLTA